METEQLIQPVAASLNVEPSQVRNTLKLLEEGNTVPFIARYRKEMTKGLDEEQILFIQQQVQYLSNLEKRKEDVLRIIETQGKLTEELRQQVLACTKLSQVDDIYRPYQQKRKTRATDAAAKGLTPLADWIASCPRSGDPALQAEKISERSGPDSGGSAAGGKGISWLSGSATRPSCAGRSRNKLKNTALFSVKKRKSTKTKTKFIRCIMITKKRSVRWQIIGLWRSTGLRKKKSSR